MKCPVHLRVHKEVEVKIDSDNYVASTYKGEDTVLLILRFVVDKDINPDAKDKSIWSH